MDHPALEPRILRKQDKLGIDWIVFGITAVLSVAFVLWGVISTSSLSSASESGLDWVVTNTGWLFALASTGFVFFVIWLAASKYGNIPLGADGEEPEFRTISWIAMMFSAGMGIGLMFWGAAEPLAHYLTPPPGTGEAGNDSSTRTAMATTLFHWTLHPWAIYTVAGLAIGYGVFRKGRGLTISAVFEPLIGKRQVNGPVGKVIDIFAIFATLFGSATSLGLGALQIASGAKIVGWADDVTNTVLVLIIVVLTICFIFSAVSGVEKGIQWLSNTNMVLAFVLAAFVFVVGPTIFILNLVPTSLGTYMQHLMEYAARTNAQGESGIKGWLSGWTIFYWAWWVSWTPFVGMFIARISRGRTIREFVTGVLLVPSTVSLVWFAIFGGAAIKAQEMGATLDKFGDGEESTLFALLDSMPWAGVTSILVMVLVAIFFVSGADAASIVMGSLSERGTLEPNRFTVIFWGVATGAVAAIMLTIGGEDSLTGLQQITIIAALPFVLIMIGMAVALVKDLQSDPMAVRRAYAVEALKQAVVAGVKEHGDDFVLSIDHAEPGEGIDRDKVLHASNGGSATATEQGEAATEQAETDPRPGETPTA
ncbi:choline/carnitine/betaine transport [Janibacter hoylei PVAS-1]|uniref:Choline/carnitine/betaine transport n=1 Tax=Janibacter hoylei PVAS-1 TaxID=1210046 RepID=K1E442_9MICO|nr:BCCT family transporter [Janibacter hoylei]EKA61786.1 choline/carnitine/betaine transport [Janibacter hoylei PVAS-1]